MAEYEPLSAHCTLRVGGSARWFALPQSVDMLEHCVRWARRAHLLYFVLGGGSNLILSDAGYPGLVLSVRELTGYSIDGSIIRVASGHSLASLAVELASQGLSGLEWACGIPGTLGGAVVMNAGAHGHALSSILTSIRLLQEDGVREIVAEELGLGYRTSRLRTGELRGIVLGATLSLTQDDISACRRRIDDFARWRIRTQPQGATCGSVFRNPINGLAAGQLLDQSGCKGMRVGDVVVSSKHANFILNERRGNATDALQLIDLMRRRVLDRFGIALEHEVQIIR